MPKVRANGINLYYEEAGSGIRVVFVHEFGGEWRSWEPRDPRQPCIPTLTGAWLKWKGSLCPKGMRRASFLIRGRKNMISGLPPLLDL